MQIKLIFIRRVFFIEVRVFGTRKKPVSSENTSNPAEWLSERFNLGKYPFPDFSNVPVLFFSFEQTAFNP